MNVHPSYERLIKYAAGDTQEDADHIIACAQCGETVSSFRNVQALIRSDDFVTPPDRTIARAQAIFVPHRYKPRPQPMRFSWSLGFAMAVSSFIFFCVGVLFAQVTQSGITIVIGPRSPSAPAVIDAKPTQSSGTAVIEFPRHTPIPTPQDQPPKVPKLLLPSDTEPESDVPLFPDQASTTITLTVPVTSSLPVDVEPTPQPPVSPTPLPSTDQESPSQPPSAPPPQPTSAPPPEPTSAPSQPPSAPPPPTSAPPPQPTSAPPPQPTSAPSPEPTSAPPPQPTSAPPPQPTSAPPPQPTSAPPPQPTSAPPPSKTPPVINPGQWNA